MHDHHHGHRHHHDRDHHHAPHPSAEPPVHASRVRAGRRSKDDYFARSPRSPLPHDERQAFAGLPYYPVDTSLRFEFLELGQRPDGLDEEAHVQTSDGRVRHGSRVGSLRFEVDGVEQQLVVLRLESSQDGSLFVPFRDSTNGSETYGAGRYLDLAAQDDGTYDLDFDLAYAPSVPTRPPTPARSRRRRTGSAFPSAQANGSASGAARSLSGTPTMAP